jgi:hypothetical protein
MGARLTHRCLNCSSPGHYAHRCRNGGVLEDWVKRGRRLHRVSFEQHLQRQLALAPAEVSVSARTYARILAEAKRRQAPLRQILEQALASVAIPA